MIGATVETSNFTKQNLFPNFIASDFDERKAALKKLFRPSTFSTETEKVVKPPDDDRFSVDSLVNDFQSASTSTNLTVSKKTSMYPGKPPDKPVPPDIKKKKAFPGKPPGKCPLPKFSSKSQLNESSIYSVPKAPDGVKGKPLSWKIIPISKTAGSIWASFHKNESKLYPLKKCEPDFTKLTKFFFEVEDQKPLLTKPKSTSFTDTIADDSRIVHVISAKRRQNVEICMKGLGILDNIEPLLVTLSLSNSRESCKPIPPENLQLILAVYPTEEEQKLLLQAQTRIKNNNSLKLGKVTHTNSTSLFRRRSFDEDLTALGSKISRYQKCLNVLIVSLQSGALRMFLYVVLQMGNYLNSGTKKGLAAGFTLDSLFLLKSIKSIDDSTNLLYEVVHHFNSLKFCEAAFWEDLQTCLGLCQCSFLTSFEDLKTVYQQLTVKFCRVDELINKDLANDTSFIASFSSFLQSTKIQLSHVQKSCQEVEANFTVFLNLVAHRPQTIAEGVEVLKKLNRFWKELSVARTEICKKKSLVDVSTSLKGSLTARGTTTQFTHSNDRSIKDTAKSSSFMLSRRPRLERLNTEPPDRGKYLGFKPPRRFLYDKDMVPIIQDVSSVPNLCSTVAKDSENVISCSSSITKSIVPSLNLNKITLQRTSNNNVLEFSLSNRKNYVHKVTLCGPNRSFNTNSNKQTDKISSNDIVNHIKSNCSVVSSHIKKQPLTEKPEPSSPLEILSPSTVNLHKNPPQTSSNAQFQPFCSPKLDRKAALLIPKAFIARYCKVNSAKNYK